MVGNAYDEATNLGAIVMNLQALEFCLRAFLLQMEARDRRDRGDPPMDPIAYPTLAEGNLVPENAFTNYDQLSALISKYNQRIGQVNKALRVDPLVVRLRDALAHGRVGIPGGAGCHQLLKFSRPRKSQRSAGGDKVCVEFAAYMDRAWFDQQIRWTRQEGKKVVRACEKMGITTASGSLLIGPSPR